MKINTSFSIFKKKHKNKRNQIIFHKAECNNKKIIENIINNYLLKKYELHLNEFLNIRSFIDHNRVFEMPKMGHLNLKGLSTNSTAAFCINNSNKILAPIIFKISLTEHFLKWKPFANKHGLLILELHTISTKACSENIGNRKLAYPIQDQFKFPSIFITLQNC